MNDPESSKLVTKMNMDDLKVAPIHNLDPERAVGSINYGLGICGRCELQAASSSYLKGKSYDLIELKPPDEYKKYQKKVKKVNLLIEQWKQKQSELESAGLDKKEAIAITTDKRKFRDLEKLKSLGGPFVSSDEVDGFINNEDIPEKVKEDRMYTEVRYARDTSLSLPTASEICQLQPHGMILMTQ